MQSATRTDPTSVLKHIDTGPDSSRTALVNVINSAFLAPMNCFTPLDSGVSIAVQYTDTPTVTEFSVLKKLIALNPAKASGPDGVPAWLLKENADLLAPVVTDILNSSYLEVRLPQSWKLANVVPLPKQTHVYDVNKHLRPISLTPVLSKLAEDFVVDRYVKPAVLAKADPRQFGTVPGSSTTEALISMTHAWYSATDGASVSVILFDFKKAFDLIDHQILVKKLGTYNISNAVISWIIDFLTSSKQRVKTRPRLLLRMGRGPSGGSSRHKTGAVTVYHHDQRAGCSWHRSLELKRSGLGTRELVQFFCTCIRPITEYACPVFHDGLG
ncbi:Transposon TX1 uncharacterized 149 kDa protein [Stylophora pistillata]|uniref:Transposon TX1 uncharacterized 149 kDa protein n=1 Tax=Stylophora pistillata TaxID=50429 RepID=A0A2B4SZY8_STYPI|nr:Transposon TX1 uncharacterized 149 kDa protein [Stylophora pistillata]